MNKKKSIMLSIDFMIVLLLIAIDQTTKYLAVVFLKDEPAVSLIKNVLSLHYLENKGAAFGLLQGQKWFILFIGILFLFILGLFLWKLPESRKFIIMHIVCAFMCGGAIGNMIDRIRLNYVIDFIYFSAIDFPIFNCADIFVTLSVIVAIILMLFVYKEEDLAFLNFKQKKYRDVNKK